MEQQEQIEDGLRQVDERYEAECARIRATYAEPLHPESEAARVRRERAREDGLRRATQSMHQQRKNLAQRLGEVREEIEDYRCTP